MWCANGVLDDRGGDGRVNRRVFIHKNEASAEGRVLIVSDDLAFDTFKRIVGEKLGIKRVKRVFHASGTEVFTMGDIINNDNLYFSSGEPFYRTSGSGAEKMFFAVLGSGGVGKSAVTLRYVRDFFVKKWEATIEDAYRKTTRIDDRVTVLEVLDTAGQEDFSAMRAQWMTDKDGYVFVYSLDDEDSLQQLYDYLETMEQVNAGKSPAPPIVVVGNKKDLVDADPDRRAVTLQAANAFVQACRDVVQRIEEGDECPPSHRHSPRDQAVIHFETSALTGEHTEAVFEHLVREVRKQRKPVEQKSRWCFLL